MGLTKHKLVVDTTSVANSDQIWSYLSDASGKLLTSTLVGSDQALDVNIVQAAGVGAHNEDDAHISGDQGVLNLAVRADTKASTAGTDGDYAALIQNGSGELYTVDESGNALLTTIDADTSSMNTNLATVAGAVSGTEMQVDIVASLPAGTNNIGDVDIASMSGQYAEDTAHVTADLVVPAGVVRSDTLASLADTDGDYTMLQVNANGALYVDVTDTSFGINAEYAEDSAHSTGETGVFSLAVAKHGVRGALHSADADYAAFLVDALGQLIVNSAPNSAALSSTGTIGVTAVELAGTPLAERQKIIIQNLGNRPIYLGHDATVTTSSGIEVSPGDTFSEPWGEDINIYAISGTASQDVRVLEVA